MTAGQPDAGPAGLLIFGEMEYEHATGDRWCRAGWCAGGSNAWPRSCERAGCIGLVHANFGDEGWDDYWLETRCDVCGEPE